MSNVNVYEVPMSGSKIIGLSALSETTDPSK